MKRHVKFPSIGQFRNAVSSVKHFSKQNNLRLPTVNAVGTEKIHGTNSSVCFNSQAGFWVQSKERVLSVEKDNYKCALWCEDHKEEWMGIIHDLAAEHDIDLHNNIITIYFEWCGGGIQKKSAISGLDKRAIIFRHFSVATLEPTFYNNDPNKEYLKWYPTTVRSYHIDCVEHDIHNIMNFPKYKFTIDFENPLLTQNEMIRIVEEVIEPDSPVGKVFGKDGNVGEGIVVSFMFGNELITFKVKGEKHSKSKVKTLKPVDEVKEQLKNDIAQQLTPAWRLEQMFDEANNIGAGEEPTIKNMGAFIKLVNGDIIKEENDIIKKSGLTHKEVFNKTSYIARTWYQDQLNELAFA